MSATIPVSADVRTVNFLVAQELMILAATIALRCIASGSGSPKSLKTLRYRKRVRDRPAVGHRRHLLLPNKIGFDRDVLMAVFDHWRLSRPVMPGLEASTWRLTLLSCGCRAWMHGSSPCMTNLAPITARRTILHIVSKNAFYSIRSDTWLCGGEDREMSRRRFPGYRRSRHLRRA
jgi:hypothetical protein